MGVHKIEPHQNAWDFGYKSTWDTTHKTDFTEEVAKAHFARKATPKKTLGFANVESGLSLRKIVLKPIEPALSVTETSSTSKTPIITTHLADFIIPGFDIKSHPTPASKGLPAGRATHTNRTSLQYCSDAYHALQPVRVTNKKTMGIFLYPEEQHKRRGIQTFRDWPVESDKVGPRGRAGLNEYEMGLMRKRVEAGLTIPIVNRQNMMSIRD